MHSRFDTQQTPGEPRRLREGNREIHLNMFNRSGEGISGYHYDPLFPKPNPPAASPRSEIQSPGKERSTPADALIKERAHGVLANLKAEANRTGNQASNLKYAFDNFYFSGLIPAARKEFRACVEYLARNNFLAVKSRKSEIADWIVELKDA